MSVETSEMSVIPRSLHACTATLDTAAPRTHGATDFVPAMGIIIYARHLATAHCGFRAMHALSDGHPVGFPFRPRKQARKDGRVRGCSSLRMTEHVRVVHRVADARPLFTLRHCFPTTVPNRRVGEEYLVLLENRSHLYRLGVGVIRTRRHRCAQLANSPLPRP